MKCVYHIDREAEYTCPSCGQPICRECTTYANGKAVCRACAQKTIQQGSSQAGASNYNNQQYSYQQYKQGDGVSGFLFFIFLAVPGLRHMYLGFMKRGLHFLVAFFGVAALGAVIGRTLGSMAVPIAFILWFYSAFDSYQLRKLKAKGEKIEDSPLFKDYGFEQFKDFVVRRKSLVGVVTIIFGVYLLFDNLIRYSWRMPIPKVVVSMMDLAFDSMIPILFILGGIYLMTRVGKNKNISSDE